MSDKSIRRQSPQASAVGEATREKILRDPGATFVWRCDCYPCELGRWNYHPEFEIHLVRNAHGRVFIGDHIGKFAAGHLAIVGPNLPHEWVSDIEPGQVIEGRDVVIQFDPEALVTAQDVFPELRSISDFIARARRGLRFLGSTAEHGARLLEEIGASFGARRLILFLELLEVFSSSNEYEVLCSDQYAPYTSPEYTGMMKLVLNYISENYTRELTMNDAADVVGLSPNAFSKIFRKNTGYKFLDYIRKVRIGHAVTLLVDTDVRVTEICFRTGFQNISYFNRQFLREKGVSPRQYRKMAKRSERGIA